mgnify:CR=1 FL=1
MLREFFLYLSQAAWAQRAVTGLWLGRKMAQRFVAGSTIEEAISVLRGLNQGGMFATLDFLGESVKTAEEAGRARDEYLLALRHVEDSAVQANVSIKLTQFGLDIDPRLCTENVLQVVERARQSGTFVRIDMEGTPHTDRTLAVVDELRRSSDWVGVVLQAYLYRSEQDLVRLTSEGTRIRLCKGAYQEPPDKAFPKKADVDANYVKLAQLLLQRSAQPGSPGAERDGRVPPLAALATHDEKMIAAAQAFAQAQGIDRRHFEFQMLFGIRRDLQESLVQAGYPVRIYVPYGTHWYPYFMRRLAERPANVWFLLSNLLRR